MMDVSVTQQKTQKHVTLTIRRVKHSLKFHFAEMWIDYFKKKLKQNVFDVFQMFNYFSFYLTQHCLIVVHCFKMKK